MTGVRKSFLLSLADSYLALVLQLAGAVVISRLLTPSEVGVFAIAAIFAGLASAFRDFGIAEYLIQERELTPEKMRAALGLNILVSWFIACMLAVAAPVAAQFFREAGVRDVMWVQALNFALVPFGAVTLAWFRRELNYLPIVISNGASSVAAFVVSVILAWNGHGYMSLAWSSLAGIVVAVGTAVWFRPAELPRLPALKGIGQVFQFGKFASAMTVTGQVGKGAPEFIVGRVQGAADVGLFSRANGLVEIVNRLLMRPVMQICMPHFARSLRETGTLRPAYLSSVALLTAAGWPLLGVFAVMSFPAIRLVYGAQWLQAVPVAQVLCLAMMLGLVHGLSRDALVARGDVSRANLLQAQIVVLQVTGLLAGIVAGLQGAAWGLVAAATAGIVLSQWHLNRAIGLTVMDMLAATRGSATLAGIVVLPLAVAALWAPPSESNYLSWALGGGASALLFWLGGLRVLRHPLWNEVEGLVLRLRRWAVA